MPVQSLKQPVSFIPFLTFSLLVLIILIGAPAASATTYTFNHAGRWFDPKNWTPSYPGSVIAAGDTVKLVGQSCSIDPDSSITSNGTILSNDIFLNEGYFTNNGSFVNNRSFLNDYIFINGGLFFGNGAFSNYFSFYNNGRCRMAGFSILQGNFVNGMNSDLTFQTGSIVQMNGSFRNQGNVECQYQALIQNYNTLNNDGIFHADGSLTNYIGAILNNSRSFSNTGTFSDSGAINNMPGAAMGNRGILAIVGQGSYVNASLLSNQGTLIIGQGDSLVQLPLSTLQNDSTLTSAGTIINQGSMVNSLSGVIQCTAGNFYNGNFVQANNGLRVTLPALLTASFGSSTQNYSGPCNCYAITQQPSNQSAVNGGTAVFRTIAKGGVNGQVLTYNWQYSPDGGKTWGHGPSDDNNTNATFTLFPILTSYNKYQFRCMITGYPPFNVGITDAATLSVTSKK